MTINWIRCSDQMPPDDRTVIIARHPDIDKPHLEVWAFQFHINKAHGFLDDRWEWSIPMKPGRS